MRTLTLTILLLASLTGITQDHRARLDETAGTLLASYRNSGNQEVMLHMDKPYYPLGSTLWFRVFLVQAFTKMPAASARVYVDLVDGQDSIVQRTLLNSASFEWDGGIRISSNWKEGLYQLRVYTAEMLAQPNIGKPLVKPVYFFDPATQKQEILRALPPRAPGISYAIEGGTLINGVPNLLAVRTFDNEGNPLATFGYVRDDQNKVVETFKTQAGYGKLLFSPSKNKKYDLVVSMPGGSEQSFSLPPAPNDGWQLSLVRSTAQALQLRIAQGDSLYEKKPFSYLVGVANAKIVFASYGSGLYEVNVPLKDLPAGTNTFHLFNDQLKHVSSRQVTIRPDGASLSSGVNPNKTSYAPRETVNIDLDLKDASGQPLNALLSVAVTNDSYFPQPDQETPNELLDVLSPQDLKAVELAKVLDSTMAVRGTVLLADGQPAANHIVNVLSTEDNFLVTDTTDNNGRFYVKTPEFYTGKPFMVQVADMSGAQPAVTVETSLDPVGVDGGRWQLSRDTISGIGLYAKNEADSFLTGLSRKTVESLSQQYATGFKGKKANENRNKFSRMITAEQLDRLNLGTTANAVMMIPGVFMMGQRLTIRGGVMSLSGGMGDIEPLVIIDGVPAGSSGVVDLLNSISPQIIESIEVLAGGEAAMYGTRAANGVILVKTNTSLRNGKGKTQAGMQYVYPVGYHQVPEFFIPKYEIPQVREFAFVDNRSTIFWKGEVLTDKNGKARLSFYAADEPATYSIRIRGVSSKGDLIDKWVRVKR